MTEKYEMKVLMKVLLGYARPALQRPDRVSWGSIDRNGEILEILSADWYYRNPNDGDFIDSHCICLWPDQIDLYIEVGQIPEAWAGKYTLSNNRDGKIVRHRWSLYTFNPDDFIATIKIYKDLPTSYKWTSSKWM